MLYNKISSIISANGGAFMSADNRLGKGRKFLSIILGALVCGFMWRARGEHGFGSAWGLTGVFAVMTLLIFAFYGNRAKIKYELLPLGCITAFLATPAWGVVNGLAGGYMRSGAPSPETGEELQSVVNGYHGLIMLIMTGFALICLYGIFAGTLFSSREYKFYHYAVYAAVFLAVVYIAKTTYAHYLVKLIIPEAEKSFSQFAVSAGFANAKQAYLKYFFDYSGLKKLLFGRAYAECVEHIAFVSGALALILTALIAFRDKITALVSLVINFFAAIGITVSDVFLISDSGSRGSILFGKSIPAFLNIKSWGLWEYFTGFFIGLGIMLIIALLPDKYTAGRHYRNEPAIANKGIRFAYNLLLTFGFALLAVPVRASGLRIADFFESLNLISESRNELVSYIVLGVAGVICAAVVIAVLKKNILDKNLPVPVRKKPLDFAQTLLPVYILIILVIFLIPDGEGIAFIREGIKNPAAVPSGLDKANTFAALSAVISLLILIPLKKREKKHRKHSSQ